MSLFIQTIMQVVHGSLEVSCYNKIPLSELSVDDIPEALRNKQHLLEKGYIVPAETVMFRTPTGKPMKDIEIKRYCRYWRKIFDPRKNSL